MPNIYLLNCILRQNQHSKTRQVYLPKGILIAEGLFLEVEFRDIFWVSKKFRKNSLVIIALLIATDSVATRLLINGLKLLRDTKIGFGSSETLEFLLFFDAKNHLFTSRFARI